MFEKKVFGYIMYQFYCCVGNFNMASIIILKEMQAPITMFLEPIIGIVNAVNTFQSCLKFSYPSV